VFFLGVGDRSRTSYLGLQLLKEGIITEAQLNEALEYQESDLRKGSKNLLGESLCSLGFCSEEDIAKVMAKKAGVPYVSLKQKPIDVLAERLISPNVAFRFKAIPIGIENDKLLVAMKNPLNIIVIDDLKLMTGYKIQPVVTTDSELNLAIKQYTNMRADLEGEEEEDQEVENFPGSPQDSVIDDGFDSSSGPIVKIVNQIFSQSLKARASDVHIEPQEKRVLVRFRIDGVLHEIMQHPIKLHRSIVSRIKVISNMDISERRIPQDGRTTLKMEGKMIDVRVASLPTAYGEKITMRLLNRSDKFITLAELGFPETELEKYHSVMKSSHGFILITGPTGSGKSTTLYATLERLNSPDKNIITLEDPIERRMNGINQVQINQKADMTFSSGLRSILRNDPDTIMIGEIRDHETAKIAIESALTGHLVLSTLHTNDSAGAIARLADMDVEQYLTASSLIGVVAQRLVRILCDQCKTEYEITREELIKNIPDFPFAKSENVVKLYKPKGCVNCNNTGYIRRKGIYEFLKVSENIQKLILTHASSQEIKNVAVSEGMITLRQDGLKKVIQGITSLEELLRVMS
jgi:type IV pilus assembly protein PilB